MKTRTVTIWGGEAVLSAAGSEADAALCAAEIHLAMVMRELDADLDLLSRRSLDVLPRSAAARRAVEARRKAAQIFQSTDEAALPPALVALRGALADELLGVLTGHQGVEAAAVSAGAAMSASGAAMPAGSEFDELIAELHDALGGRAIGGLAISGLAGPHPIIGLADITACAAGTAADAAMAAAVLGDAVSLASDVRDLVVRCAGDAPGAGVYGPGFRGLDITKDVGQIALDLIWEALSAGVRRASAFRQARLISAAVLTLKGRGRIVGSVDVDRLLRFGVSDWR